MAAVTDNDIEQYLNTRDDFDLELFVHRSLVERGLIADHGGTYVDPYTGKPRQFDVWARKEFDRQCDLLMAIECKSLTTEAPLIISRSPRPGTHVQFDVLKTWLRAEVGKVGVTVERSDLRYVQLYGAGQMVGKQTRQLRVTV